MWHGQDLIGWLETGAFRLFNPHIPPTETEAYAGARLSTLDLITTGITTTVDWSPAFTPEFVRGNIQALSGSGLRFVFALYGSANRAIISDMKRVKQTLIDPTALSSSRSERQNRVIQWDARVILQPLDHAKWDVSAFGPGQISPERKEFHGSPVNLTTPLRQRNPRRHPMQEASHHVDLQAHLVRFPHY